MDYIDDNVISDNRFQVTNRYCRCKTEKEKLEFVDNISKVIRYVCMTYLSINKVSVRCVSICVVVTSTLVK